MSLFKIKNDILTEQKAKMSNMVSSFANIQKRRIDHSGEVILFISHKQICAVWARKFFNLTSNSSEPYKYLQLDGFLQQKMKLYIKALNQLQKKLGKTN